MNFGDWELFRMVIISLREHEVTSVTQMEETGSSRNVRFATQDMTQDRRSKFVHLLKSVKISRMKPCIMYIANYWKNIFWYVKCYL